MTLTGARLALVPATLEHVQALIAGDFEAKFGWRVMPGWLEFPEALPYMAKQLQTAPDWGPYLFVHTADQALVGLGGFKSAPAGGEVEIGYGVAFDYRGAGLAGEAVSLMAARAARDGVRTLVALTLPEENASTRVLRKAGFELKGPVEDPNDGTVWRWEHAF